MALKKSVELVSGASAEYFRICELVSKKREITLHVDLYKDKAAREAGKAPIERNVYQKSIVPPEGFSFLASSLGANFYSEAYVYLKTLPMFDGCEDV